AHELAHQWFGNLVTMEWWDDLWLNESFADWMADKITHQLYPELAADVSAINSGDRIMGEDAQAASIAIRQPVTQTDSLLQDVGLAYAKGKIVLGMFEQWIGEEAFRRGVLDYLKAREWGNATADDLFAALAKASEKPIAPAMASFIDQPGVPRIEVEVGEGGAVRLTQARYQQAGASLPATRWQVPVVLRYQLVESGTVATRTVVLEETSASVELGGDVQWLHPNAGARGYYRWSLPLESLEVLAGQVDALDVTERINLVGNTSALLESGDIDGGAFLRVLRQVLTDPNPSVVGSALRELEPVEEAFIPDALKPTYSHFIGATLRPVLDRVGDAPRAGEPETVTLLRPRLQRWLARHGDAAVVRDFRAKAKAFLKDPTSISPAAAPLALNLLAKDGDAELFDELQGRAEQATTPSLRGLYLSALGGFEAKPLRDRALAYAFGEKVRPNEIFSVLGPLFETEEGQDLVFDHMIENWGRVTAKLPPPFLAFLPRVADGCSAERLERATAFFSQPENAVDGTARSLSRVSESIRSCVAMRARESPSVAAYLKAFRADHPAADVSG
ncbi:MAG: ERAP1-like C-terminal domain-containing protein, partial [Acidobacteriota bacterium]